MSWLARSIAATLSAAQADDSESESEVTSGDKSPTRAPGAGDVDVDEPDQQPDTPSRGVKGDISELTESLTRRFWGVASFLAPPPQPVDDAGVEEEAAPVGEEGGTQSPRIGGIRSDLAEIGGRVRTGISMLSNAKAVAEISRIASSFLPLGPEEEDGEAVGVTEEVVVFVTNITKHPETWLDFPLFTDNRHADDFELSETQYGHALAVERLVPSLSYLRTQLCYNYMSEGCFWKIYFVLIYSILNEQDAELLSTPQILEAREALLDNSMPKDKLSSEGNKSSRLSSENRNVLSARTEDRELSPSSTQNKSEALPHQEPTFASVLGVEADKHPISTTVSEIIDKSVIQEELVVKKEMKSIPTEKSAEDDDKEVEEWLQDMPSMASKTAYTAAIGEEEDVSFSDLEDD